MAELGETGDPIELIPGNPSAIDDNVIAIRGRGDAMELAGTSLRRIDTGDYWSGDTANAFRDVFSYEPPRWITAADSFHQASEALRGFADVLRWAQTQAQAAIHRWDEAQETTRRAIEAHNAAVTEADTQNAANALAGSNTRIEVAAFVDPGNEGREAARGLLQGARYQLQEAGDRAATTLTDATEDAPEVPGSGVGFFFKEIGAGAWESVTDLWDMNVKYNPILAGNSPSYGEDLRTFAAGVGSAVTNPTEFGKQLIDYDTWKESPGRAIGHLVPDAIAAAATGGVGAVGKRVGVSTVEAAEEAAQDIASEAAEAAVPKGPSLEVKYKDGWSAAQQAEMDRKIDGFNRALEEEGFTRTTPVPRDPAVRREFLDTLDLDRTPQNTQVDHTRDLQAGGKDEVANMQILDSSVNMSFGSQLRVLMDRHPPGTVFSAVELLRDGN